MKPTLLPKGDADIIKYSTPLCKIIDVDIQGIICQSDPTEVVTENDGEW